MPPQVLLSIVGILLSFQFIGEVVRDTQVGRRLSNTTQLAHAYQQHRAG